MDKKDWLLAVLDAGRSLSPVRLQKSLFLIGMKAAESVSDDFYDFVPFDYGPFSAQIYSDASDLEREGLAFIDNPYDRGWRRYGATEAGKERAAELFEKMDDNVAAVIHETVSWVRRQSFASLVRTVHEQYPEYSVNSIFKEL